MSCERFHAALAAHAAGGELDAAAARHLAGCGACRDRLDALQRALAELDGEIDRTLAISASPDFAARVVQAASADRVESGRWRVARPLAAGLAMAAAIVLMVWVRQAAVVRDSTPAAAIHAPEATQIGSTPAEPDPATPSRTAPVASASRRPSHQLGTPPKLSKGRQILPAPQSEPPVIVEPSRALALQRLRELNAQGRLDGNVLPPPVTPETALAELTVAPLAVADIQVPDVEIVNRPPAAPQRQ
jgi:hypothetical protein